jgi:hypothetical protein
MVLSPGLALYVLSWILALIAITPIGCLGVMAAVAWLGILPFLVFRYGELPALLGWLPIISLIAFVLGMVAEGLRLTFAEKLTGFVTAALWCLWYGALGFALLSRV